MSLLASPIVAVPLWVTDAVFSHSTVPPIIKPETVVVPSVSSNFEPSTSRRERVGAGQKEMASRQDERVACALAE